MSAASPARAVLALLAAAAVFVAGPVRADDGAVVDRWYAALLAADRDGLSALLSDDARIKLDDLGIEQSKAEFLASLDEWRHAVAGARIRHRIEASEPGVVTAIACYDFPANDLLLRESFVLARDHINGNSQARLAESCDGY